MFGRQCHHRSYNSSKRMRWMWTHIWMGSVFQNLRQIRCTDSLLHHKTIWKMHWLPHGIWAKFWRRLRPWELWCCGSKETLGMRLMQEWGCCLPVIYAHLRHVIVYCLNCLPLCLKRQRSWPTNLHASCSWMRILWIYEQKRLLLMRPLLPCNWTLWRLRIWRQQ